MARFNSFRELLVWQLGMDLVDCVYQLTRGLPKDERYGMTSQIRRAAVSIPANIAEGFCRHSRAAYRHHVSIALGSQAELLTYIELCRRLAFIDERQMPLLWDRTTQVGRLLNGLWEALGTSRSVILEDPPEA